MCGLNGKHFIFCNAQAISELAPLQILQQARTPRPSEKEEHTNRNVKRSQNIVG